MRSLAILLMPLLLVAFVFGAIGCGVEEASTATPVPSDFRTFAKYGFSFEYPKTFGVNEMGKLSNEADDGSGIVQVFIEKDMGIELFQVGWVETAQSTMSILVGGLEVAFAKMESYESVTTERGELVQTSIAGHQMLFQYFNATGLEGTSKVYGFLGCFYCDGSQRYFILTHVSSTLSAKEDLLEDFMTYLDSFVCH